MKKLAISLERATELFMRKKSVAREVLGDDFVEHFGGTREHEVKLWNEAVTNWECESLAWCSCSEKLNFGPVERYLELS